nr:MAG TPA: hypothetical protein [Caudoviricetes sp.]
MDNYCGCPFGLSVTNVMMMLLILPSKKAIKEHKYSILSLFTLCNVDRLSFFAKSSF